MTIFDGDAPPHNHHREIIERLTRELEYYAGLAEESERLRSERDAAIARADAAEDSNNKLIETWGELPKWTAIRLERDTLRAALREAGEAMARWEHLCHAERALFLSRINELTKE